MPEPTPTDPGKDQPNARTLNDLLRIRADNLDRIHHRYGAIGTAVGYKIVGKSLKDPQPAQPAPAILIFVPKKLEVGALIQDQKTGDDLLLYDTSGKLSCRTDVISAELDAGHPIIPDLSPENVALVRRLNSGKLGLKGGVAIENLSLPQPTSRQLTLSCALVRDLGGGRQERGFLTNAHAAVEPNPKIGLVSNPGNSQEVGILDSTAVESDAFKKTIAPLLKALDPVETHFDAAFVKMNALGATQLKAGVDGLPPLGAPYELNLDTMGPIGKEVVSVGQQSGKQTGRIFAYGFAWRDSTNHFHWTDYLIYSENERFSLPGDSGKLIVTADGTYQPLALHWGGSFSQLRPGGHKEWWGYSTDIGRVLRGLNATIYRDEPLTGTATGASKEPNGSTPKPTP